MVTAPAAGPVASRSEGAAADPADLATRPHRPAADEADATAAAAAADAMDAVLLADLADDLDGTFERLVLAYQRRLYGFALRYAGTPEDAEEIGQDAFVRAYRALEGYDAARVRDLALRPWLYRITLNVARNRARRVRPRLVSLDGSGGPDGEPGVTVEPVADERERPESVVARAEGDVALAALLAALPPRYRAAVILRHVEGLGYEKAAAALGQPVGTVKSNVHRGLRLLRVALADQDNNREVVR